MMSRRPAAYGGERWAPRCTTTEDELGIVWSRCGTNSEVAPLRAVLLHEPGAELEQVDDPDRFQMLDRMDPVRARAEHRALAEAYASEGVAVHMVVPGSLPPPNLVYVADLVFMTPRGAIVGRPASVVRAGEEVHVARRLAHLGIPILRTVHGPGVFECADAAWLDDRKVLLATGPRTDSLGARQVALTLAEQGVDVVMTSLVDGDMHLMGQLRFLDRDLALLWPGRVTGRTTDALVDHGYGIIEVVNTDEATRRMAMNLVTLGPRRVIIPSGNPATRAMLEGARIQCITVQVDELIKGAGGIGCMTGVLERAQMPQPNSEP